MPTIAKDRAFNSGSCDVAVSRYQPPTGIEPFPFVRRRRRLQPKPNAGLHCTRKVRLRIGHAAFKASQKGEAVRRYSSTLQPITAQRIERALDRVAEIIVARHGSHCTNILNVPCKIAMRRSDASPQPIGALND